jgi:hypothetical protein
VHRNGKQVSASIRGNREVGVVKWVKESYGFIQSAGVHSATFFFLLLRHATLLSCSATHY